MTLSDPFHRTKGNLKEAERNYTLLGNNYVTTEYLGAGIVVRELRIKNVLNAFGSIQQRYIQLRLKWAIKAKGNMTLCNAISD